MLNSAVRWLEQTARRFPGKTAVEDEHGSFTWAELEQQAASVASAILSRGFGPNRPVLVFLPKSKESVATFLGALYAGCPYAPVDYAIPTGRLEKTVENLRPALIVADRAALERLGSLDLYGAEAVLYEELASFPIDRGAVSAALDRVIDTDPAYIMYTSGSTGTPKGVAVPHRGVLEYAQAVTETFRITEQSVLGLQSGFHFDNSTFDLYASLSTGAKLVIIPEVLFLYPYKLMDLMEEKEITCIFWVPTIMINVANTGALEGRTLPKLENVVFAGEVMPNRQLNIWRKALPGRTYANLYGPTEITVDCTCYIADREFADSDPLPIGKPWRGARILLLKEDDTPAAVGEEGEICVLGSGVALGYWNAPEQTAKAFVQSPLNPNYPEKMYRTGDLGRWEPDGNILFCGRRDSQIKIDGIRLELGDVEAAASCVEGVRRACALFDREKGEIVLFLETSREVTRRKFNQEMRAFAPAYMLPGRLELMDKFPENKNGKIDRPLLKQQYQIG